MKKILSVIASSVIVMSIFTACGSKSTDTSAQSASTTQSSTTKTNTQNSDNKKTPDLSGEVSAINGTEVTLKIIEVPTMGGDKGAKPADGEKKDANATTTEQSKDKTPPTDGEKPKMETKYTGETKALKIADGISITTFVKNETEKSDAQKSETEKGSPEKNGTEKTITVKDIKVGDRLNVWYTDSNKTTISKINVSSLTKN